MKRAVVRSAWCAVLGFASSAAMAANGPDVVVFDIYDLASYGAANNIRAYALGTVSCNRGNQDLNWIAGTPNVPVIQQNMFRIKDGRMEQIGMSWLKWAFASLNQSACGPCQNPGTGSRLGPSCSDPYSAGLNGSQSGLGPRSVVNAYTGFHPGSHATPSGNSTTRGRLQVHQDDMDPALNAGAIYLGECAYVAPDDAAAGNQFNNTSVRQIWVTSGMGLTFTRPGTGQQSSTLEGMTAIEAWQLLDPTVALTHFNLPNDGRVYVAWKAQSNGSTTLSADFDGSGTTDITDLGTLLLNFGSTGSTFEQGDANGDGDVNVTDLGMLLDEFGEVAVSNWHYEVAVYNQTSDRSIQAVNIHLPPGSTATNLGFKDVDYHSGEPYTNIDWTATADPNLVRWATQTEAENPNANALRWATMYNFWFDADVPPEELNTVTLDIFKTGAVNQKVFSLPAPNNNDLCGNALKLQTPTVFVSTVGATTDGPDHPGVCNTGGATQTENDVWYRFNADCTGTATAELLAGFNAKLVVYEGGCPSSGGTYLGCDDDGMAGNPVVTFPTTNGQVYFIRVGGQDGETGTGELTVECN